jgi:2-methylcitrate dehydratase PrpD
MAQESDRLAASSVSNEIAKWAAGLREEDLPEGVRQAVANTVLDTLALSIASVDTDYGRAVIQASDTPGNCTVFGHPDRLSPYDAALINGTTGHGEDFDNTYEGCPVHTGVVVVPALFAAGEAYQLPARRVALGLAVAMELMCRLGAVAMKGVHTAGFHPTSILGTVAAAVGVGVARGHNAQQIRDAMGVSASLSSGIIEYLADGSWTKRLHAGWAAQSGIRAASLGGTGFMGPISVIEGIHSLYKAFAPSIEADHALLTEGLGERWEAANIAFKPYACGTMTQPYIDCAIRLMKQGIKLDDIEEIICQVGEGTVHRLWEPLAGKQAPPTPYAAKFSGPYTVAAGFCYGDAGLAEFTETSIRNDQVLRVASKVRFEVDPDNEYPRNYTGHVTVRLKNGETYSDYQPQMRGGVREPLDREELIKKCQANLEFGHWPGIDARQLASFADSLFTSDQTFTAAALGRR